MAVDKRAVPVGAGAARAGRRRRSGEVLQAPRLSAAGVLEGVAVSVLAITLVWVPLPYGSNRPWSWSLLDSQRSNTKGPR